MMLPCAAAREVLAPYLKVSYTTCSIASIWINKHFDLLHYVAKSIWTPEKNNLNTQFLNIKFDNYEQSSAAGTASSVFPPDVLNLAAGICMICSHPAHKNIREGPKPKTRKN